MYCQEQCATHKHKFRRRQISDKSVSRYGLSTVLVFRVRNPGDRCRIMQIRSMFIHRFGRSGTTCVADARCASSCTRAESAPPIVPHCVLLLLLDERRFKGVSESSRLFVETRLYARRQKQSDRIFFEKHATFTSRICYTTNLGYNMRRI